MLPLIAQTQLNIKPIDWAGLPRRYMNPGELETIIALLRTVMPLESMLEIGVNEGRTALAILQNFPSLGKYIGIDVLPGYNFECHVQKNELPSSPGRMAAKDKRFHLSVTKNGSLDIQPNQFGQVDVVFIDGDHSVKAVMHDSILAALMVRKGGMIIWHDYHNLGTVGVKQALDKLRGEGRDIVHVENTWLAFERR